MKKQISFLAFLFNIWFLAACNPRLEGSGNSVTEDRNIPGFENVAVSGDFNVYISYNATQQAVRLSGEDNVLPHIELEVKNKKLTIKYDRNYRHSNHKTVAVYLNLPAVYSLDLSGSGEVVSTLNTVSETNISGSGNLETVSNAAELKATISGSGNTVLRGEIQKVSCKISGSGEIHAFELATKEADATISGSGSCDVNVSESLKATISGSGNVTYKGSPQVTVSVSGSGKVRKS